MLNVEQILQNEHPQILQYPKLITKPMEVPLKELVTIVQKANQPTTRMEQIEDLADQIRVIPSQRGDQ